MERPIYLDHNATTPVAAPVLAAMLPFLEREFGNPSSGHVYGARAHEAVERARKRVVLEREILRPPDPHIGSRDAISAAATYSCEGSTAATIDAPSLPASSRASAPGPQPTSSARIPGATPANRANPAASSAASRPVWRSYDCARSRTLTSRPDAAHARSGLVALIVDPIAPNFAALRRVSSNAERA
jgi:hypothetical protein